MPEWMVRCLLWMYLLLCAVGVTAAVYSTVAISAAYAILVAICAYGLSTAAIEIRAGDHWSGYA
jgi:hypothetical protein